MDISVLAYPFIFIGLYFEIFLLVTFLSKPARDRRAQVVSTKTPPVAVIVPCFNEASTIQGTIESLLGLDYPDDKLTIVLVDDGSTDNTPAVMDSFKDHAQVIVIHKENGGKHTGLNAGIAAVPHAEFIGCLDSDSFVDPESLREVIGYFDNPKVGAVTAAMSVWQPRTMLERMQNAEYIYGITQRHIISSLNGLYVTPGPFSFYRRQTIVDLGGFAKGHNTEDLEMALRLQRAGFLIENAPRARVYTKTPTTVFKLIKQRTRWTTGFLRNVINEYRDLIGNPRFGLLGILILPLGLFAIFGGIAVFLLAIFQIVYQLVNSYMLTRGIPLSYTLLPHFNSFQWFYLPISALVLISIITITGVVSFMLVGKHISQTRGNLFLGIVAYLLLFGLIAPWWLIRTVFDVSMGRRRSWSEERSEKNPTGGS